MKISFTKYPIDMILCIVWTTILLPILVIPMESIIRIILGLPLIFFIPGYTLVFALFPTKKENKGIDNIERIALSFGFSIAIVSLLGLILNYTPWQIRLEPILLLLFFFVISVGSIAFYRWKTIPFEQRFIFSFKVSLSKSNNALDNALTIILGVSIIIAAVSVFYIIVTPKIGEPFTEFYILGPTGNTVDYPRYLSAEKNASIIIGLVNYEYKPINYSIEVWLINQTILFDESTQKNETIYNQMWYIDTINVKLDSTDIEKQLPQWELNYSFSINKKGEFKLAFLLYTTPVERYDFKKDYNDIAKQKIESAYREVHLWLKII
jgi:uncharacterized membrane protein